MSWRTTDSDRHIASPLPRTAPNSGISSASWTTSAPASAAICAVPSRDPASSTTIWPAAWMARTIGPIVAAHSRAGTTTETADRSRSPKSVWLKLRTGRALSSQGDGKDEFQDAVVGHPRRGKGRRAPGADRALRRPGAQAGAASRLPEPRPDRVARTHGGGQALVAPGGRARVRVAGPDHRHDRHGQRQVTGLQPAGARHARA